MQILYWLTCFLGKLIYHRRLRNTFIFRKCELPEENLPYYETKYLWYTFATRAAKCKYNNHIAPLSVIIWRQMGTEPQY